MNTRVLKHSTQPAEIPPIQDFQIRTVLLLHQPQRFPESIKTSISTALCHSLHMIARPLHLQSKSFKPMASKRTKKAVQIPSSTTGRPNFSNAKIPSTCPGANGSSKLSSFGRNLIARACRTYHTYCGYGLLLCCVMR